MAPHEKNFVSALKKSFGTDIFTTARFKIVFLYLFMGVIILAAAGYLIYKHILSITQDVIQLVQQLPQTHTAISQSTAASLITQTINAEIDKMNLVIGLWLIVTMLLLAYLFAGITLWPIKRAMEKQGRFIGNVSHELKTPISVMKTNSEVTLLDAEHLTHDDLVAALESNLEEVDRMSKITQFLLNFSTLDNRLAKMEMISVDLSTLIRKTIASLDASAQERHVDLTAKIEGTIIIRGNPIALEEMIVNLTKNAIAYTSAGGSVTLRLSKTPVGTLLSVQDTGIGITPKDLNNIFEPFYRGQNAKKKTRGKDANAGLGLAIVQEIAAVHHAVISVKSEIGRGTTFTIKFSPLSQLIKS